MPSDPNTLELPLPPSGASGGGDDEMATLVDDAVQVNALSGLAAEVAACGGRRITRADQLQGDSDRMWAVYMTTPNVLTGVGYRTLQQDTGYPTPAR